MTDNYTDKHVERWVMGIVIALVVLALVAG